MTTWLRAASARLLPKSEGFPETKEAVLPVPIIELHDRQVSRLNAAPEAWCSVERGGSVAGSLSTVLLHRVGPRASSGGQPGKGVRPGVPKAVPLTRPAQHLSGVSGRLFLTIHWLALYVLSTPLGLWGMKDIQGQVSSSQRASRAAGQCFIQSQP